LFEGGHGWCVIQDSTTTSIQKELRFYVDLLESRPQKRLRQTIHGLFIVSNNIPKSRIMININDFRP
jgi:hypothetical protein